jgi:hypothetical protein
MSTRLRLLVLGLLGEADPSLFAIRTFLAKLYAAACNEPC